MHYREPPGRTLMLSALSKLLNYHAYHHACRCTVANATLGTNYPTNIERCLKKLSGMEVGAVMAEYGFSKVLPAEMLKQRSTDMVTHGFEWTMEHGLPINGPRFKMPMQPACCGLAVSKRMVVCETCWQPLLPEDFSNSTDLSLVTSLVDRTARTASRR